MELVTGQLLSELRVSFYKTGEDEVLSALQFVCGPTLLPALDLVDRKSVTKLVSPSNRCLYQVMGSSGVPYSCFTTSIYCSCPSYRFGILKRSDTAMCKHVLAIRISEALDKIVEQQISDEEMANAVKNLD